MTSRSAGSSSGEPSSRQTSTAGGSGPPFTREELLKRHVDRITTDEHLVLTLIRLAQRARTGLTEPKSATFKRGMATGYISSIAILLDVDYSQARQLVVDRWI